MRLPVVYNCCGRVSLKDKWFIEFYVRNPRNQRMVRFKKYKGINRYHSFKERSEAAEKMRQYWTNKLFAGWSPFADKNIIYDDNLEYQTAIKNYRKMVSKNGTFRFYASKYIDKKSRELEPASISTYRSRLRIFDAWLENKGLAAADVSCITHRELVAFSNHIINVTKLSKTTVQNYQNLLKEVFDVVRKERSQYPNPCFDLPGTRRVNDTAAHPIHERDIAVFKKLIATKDPQLWMACCFVYYCFLRPRKELRLLRVGDIDFGRAVIRVRAANAKTDLARVVSIPMVFLQQLRGYNLHNYHRSFYVIGKGGKPGPQPVSYNNMSARWVKFRRELGMPEEYKMYSWKHTGNGRAAVAGIPMRDLQEQNGHSTVQMTEKYLKNIHGARSEQIINRFPEL